MTRQLPVIVTLQNPFQIALQRVQAPAGKQADFGRIFRGIQGSKNVRNLLGLTGG